jgi:hypothetical protein
VFITTRYRDGSVSNVSYQAIRGGAASSERIEVFGGTRAAIVDDWDRVELWADGRRATARGRKDKGHLAGIQAFLQACRDGGPSPISWSDVYGTAWASLMAVRSLREGRPVDIIESEQLRADLPLPIRSSG